MPLRLVYFGTPAFAVPTLRALAATAHPIVAVVTQPDRPRGRGQRVSASPVKGEAAALGLPVLQPERMTDPDFLAALRAAAPDLGVVAAYGQILPAPVLALPRLGLINVHASLLPRWRGAAPIHRAIIAGDAVTGITIMRVVAALDAGPMLARAETAIDPDETSTALELRLAEIGARLAVERVDALAHGPVAEAAQDDRLSTYARRLARADGRIDFERPARDLHNAIRGLQPWPMASAQLHGRRLVLCASAVASDRGQTAPAGTILEVAPDAIVVATAPGAIRLTRVQPEGRAAMAIRDFLNGHPTRAGDRFDPLPATTP